MTEDLASSLASYKVQLTQVDAALTTDPENDELMKLKQDLLEVIQLTEDLLGTETAAKEEGTGSEPTASRSSHHSWKPGDKCLALKNDDGKFYEAVIEDILPESETVAVSFPEHGKSDICQISTLKPLPAGSAPALPASSQAKSKTLLKKEQQIAQREYRKRRNQKKKQRAKEKEAESEIAKNKWKDFNRRVYSKTSKGRVRKSIFASPEGASGMVGVGTCGVADKKMTKYELGAKYNARHLIPR